MLDPYDYGDPFVDPMAGPPIPGVPDPAPRLSADVIRRAEAPPDRVNRRVSSPLLAHAAPDPPRQGLTPTRPSSLTPAFTVAGRALDHGQLYELGRTPKHLIGAEAGAPGGALNAQMGVGLQRPQQAERHNLYRPPPVTYSELIDAERAAGAPGLGG